MSGATIGSDLFTTRAWFRADLERDPTGLLLRLRPGATRVVIWRSTGDVVETRDEPTACLAAAVGDRLMLFGVDDQIAVVTVDQAEGSSLRVGVDAGAIEPAAVQVLDASGLREQRRKRRRPTAAASAERPAELDAIDKLAGGSR